MIILSEEKSSTETAGSELNDSSSLNEVKNVTQTGVQTEESNQEVSLSKENSIVDQLKGIDASLLFF
jgi:hypothetical protein